MANKGMGNGPAAGPIADAPDGTLAAGISNETLCRSADHLVGMSIPLVDAPKQMMGWCGLAKCTLGAMAARIRELEAQREWRPISSAPKDGTRVDLCGPTKKGNWRRVTDCYWHRKAKAWHTSNYSKDGYSKLRLPFEATHWLPIPKTPAVQVAEGSPAGALHPTPKPDDREGR